MDKKLLRVAIIGRPNVGKSTLFNRLSPVGMTGRKVAIVHDTPGVTRDRRTTPARLGDRHFTLIDTAGMDAHAGKKDALLQAMRAQTQKAMDDADLILFLTDVTAGVTSDDQALSRLVRRANTPVILVVNKCDIKKTAGEDRLSDFIELGLGEPVAISAEHNLGFSDLYDALSVYISPSPEAEEENVAVPRDDDSAPAAKAIQIAIVGQPNAGKSTLLNTLLGEERVIVSDLPGTTRDAIAVDFTHGEQPYRLMDTAGLRRKAKLKAAETLEQMSAEQTLAAIQFAHVVLLVLDATQPFERQDQIIADHAWSEGRNLLVIVNKWDLIPHQERAKYEDDLQISLSVCVAQAKDVPVLYTCAARGEGLDSIFPVIEALYAAWSRKFPTAALNRWLENNLARHSPPLIKGRRLKIRYMTQTRTRPPTFTLFCNKPDDFPEHYKNYLLNRLRADFELPGIPLRLLVKGGKNPYEGKPRNWKERKS